MAIYLYRSRDNSRAAVEGSLQAGSREVAVSQLIQRGITPLKIQQQKVLPSKDGKTSSVLEKLNLKSSSCLLVSCMH